MISNTLTALFKKSNGFHRKLKIFFSLPLKLNLNGSSNAQLVDKSGLIWDNLSIFISQSLAGKNSIRCICSDGKKVSRLSITFDPSVLPKSKNRRWMSIKEACSQGG